MNGWIIKHCHYNELGEITNIHYTVMVEEKNWLGITRQVKIKEYQHVGFDYIMSSKKFYSEEKAEEYLTAYMRNKNPRDKWTEEIIKTINV